MKLTLVCVGRLKEGPERQIVNRYLERFRPLGASLGFAAPTVIELPESRANTAKDRKISEAADIQKKNWAVQPHCCP
jgi:23S rRNA (pseudouridine1915-N3)-methyltransferase